MVQQSPSACAVAILHGSAPLPGSELQRFLQHESIDLGSVDLVCAAASSERPENAAYPTALSVCSAQPHTRESLKLVWRYLAKGGRLLLHEQCQDPSRTDALKKDLLLSGFVDCDVSLSTGVLSAKAQKPNWDLGARTALSLKGPSAVTTSKAWAVSGDDDNDLMDDEELLTEEDKQRPVLAKMDDCDVGKSGKKACKNCTCGRAEAEEKGATVTLTQDMLNNPQSACGNCSLGDAFRCSTCPYRGLPAFEPGKKIELAANFLAADI